MIKSQSEENVSMSVFLRSFLNLGKSIMDSLFLEIIELVLLETGFIEEYYFFAFGENFLLTNKVK
ncbi:Uncharacterised protein [Streptococcus porcinus]|uniref:Uncharacterized protein n=2 Tax=Streptococcus porcinus TaxID=1340 RepID=A0A4V0GXQ2_STRPO|nr:Uncharacterised protein [Streptococcus porcinus]VTT41484.1 Uncharacterised protein [Streptococcus porcinus]VTT42319.1 Uncharacterised protein [Streptococcus porcinus]